MPRIGFAGVGEPEEWTPAPAGEYVLELLEAEDTETKSGQAPGTPMTKMKFEIVDCEGELEKYNGRTIWHNAIYSDKSLPVIKQMLRAFGAEVDDSEDAEDLEWDWDELIGTKVLVKLKSVGARKDKNDSTKEYPARNEISRWLIVNE